MKRLLLVLALLLLSGCAARQPTYTEYTEGMLSAGCDYVGLPGQEWVCPPPERLMTVEEAAGSVLPGFPGFRGVF